MTRVQIEELFINNEQPEELDNKPTKDKSFLFKKLMPSIFQTKEYVLENDSDYSPWVVNRTLSFRLDCIHEANLMNMYGFLPKDMQYNYLLNKIHIQFTIYSKYNSLLTLSNP